MWRIIEWFKNLFGGKGTTQIGKANLATSGSPGGDNCPVVTAYGAVNISISQNRTLTDPPEVFEASARGPKQRKREIVEWMRTNGLEKPLSQVLPRALELAQILGDRDLEHWVRLELFGYSREGGMTEQECVPEYREVSGRHYDRWNRMLKVDADLCEINGFRFRKPVAELEELANRTDVIELRDEVMIDIIHKHMKVDVVKFAFHAVELVGVLSAIRNSLLEKVNRIAHEQVSATEQSAMIAQ